MLRFMEALLLILSALGQDLRAADEGLTLDMAPNSVDDYYYGCRKKMAEMVDTKYLKEELCNPDFQKAWKEGESYESKQEISKRDPLKANNRIAIYVYSDTGKIYDQFNNGARNGKQNYADKTYKWYSLQFLLTEAIEILRKKQNKCFKTFRSSKLKITGFAFPSIRFGSFTSSSLDQNIAKRFGSVSCFEIYTCLGADVSGYSKLRYEKEVLIPPYETFNVIDIRTKIYQKDLWCETVYTLKSYGARSDLNCALFKKATKSITKYYGVR